MVLVMIIIGEIVSIVIYIFVKSCIFFVFCLILRLEFIILIIVVVIIIIKIVIIFLNNFFYVYLRVLFYFIWGLYVFKICCVKMRLIMYSSRMLVVIKMVVVRVMLVLVGWVV